MIAIAAAVAVCVAGAKLIRERRRRQVAERLAAATLETLLYAIDANDSETGAHVRRVAAIALTLADAAGLEERERHNVERVALFHDIGKIHEALFDILHDPSGLTPEERRAVATHPRRGGDVLAPLKAFYPGLRPGVLAHHERWDGGGYPRGLSGARIPIAARVVAIADAFDAITEGRSYSDAKGEAAAVEAIRAGRATQFDPQLVDVFLLPPVLEEVRRARRQAHAGRAQRTGRRHRQARRAPDITFRWRTTAPGRQPPARQRTR